MEYTVKEWFNDLSEEDKMLLKSLVESKKVENLLNKFESDLRELRTVV